MKYALTAALLIAGAAQAAQVKLAWDAPVQNTDGTPVTGVIDYKLYWGQSSGTYPNVTNVGPVLTATIPLPDLPLIGTNVSVSWTAASWTVTWPERTKPWFFVATANSAYAMESDYSPELAWTQPATTNGYAIRWGRTLSTATNLITVPSNVWTVVKSTLPRTALYYAVYDGSGSRVLSDYLMLYNGVSKPPSKVVRIQ